MEKKFTHAGVSTLSGVVKARFANDALRVKVLAKNGHTDIDIIDLQGEMTKEEAVAFLVSINFDNGNAVIRAALEAEVEKRTPTAGDKSPSKKEAKKPKKAPKSTPSLDAIAARGKEAIAETAASAADMEDAPY